MKRTGDEETTRGRLARLPLEQLREEARTLGVDLGEVRRHFTRSEEPRILADRILAKRRERWARGAA